MPPVEEDGGLAVRGGELQPAGRGLIGRFHFGDYAGERAVAQAIFGKRQNLGILAALRIKYLGWTEPRLLEAGRIEIELREGPKHGEAGLGGKASGDAGHEQRRGGIIVQSG